MEVKDIHEKHEQLQASIQDLLCELGICTASLKIMASGYSPYYPGCPDVGVERDADLHPRVQISKVVAQKLINAGVVN